MGILSFNRPVKLEGRVVGHIRLDGKGYYYCPKGVKPSPHDPKWHGKHFPDIEAVMRSLNGED